MSERVLRAVPKVAGWRLRESSRIAKKRDEGRIRGAGISRHPQVWCCLKSSAMTFAGLLAQAECGCRPQSGVAVAITTEDKNRHPAVAE